MNTANSYEKPIIREGTEDDKAAVLRLVSAVTDQDTAEDKERLWGWWVNDGPLCTDSTRTRMKVVEQNNEIVGVVFLAPFELSLMKGSVIGWWFQTIMMHPKYPGLGYKLVRHVLAEDNYYFGFPFPRLITWYARASKSVRGDFHVVARIFDMTLPLDLGHLVKRRRPRIALFQPLISLSWIPVRFFYTFRWVKTLRTLPNVSFEEKSVLCEEIDELWERYDKKSHITAVRNRRYLTWRFLKAPKDLRYRVMGATINGKLMGYMVYRTGDDRTVSTGFIVDFLVDSEQQKVFRGLLATTLLHLKKNGVKQVRASIAEGMREYSHSLRYMGFIIKSETNALIGMSPRTSEYLEESNRWNNPEKWYVTRADSDLDL